MTGDFENKGNEYNWKLPPATELFNLFSDGTTTIREVADQYNVTYCGVKNKLSRNGFKVKTKDNSPKYANLNHSDLDFINGLVLSDGNLTLQSYGKSVMYRHGDINRDYLVWLKQNLKLNFGEIKERDDGVFNMASCYYRDLVELYHFWYPNGKKRVPNIKLKPIILFNWYIGDGSYRKGLRNTKSAERVKICIEFDIVGRENLSKQLNGLGVETSIYLDGIYIKASGRKKFFKFMLSADVSTPCCYEYKFPEEYLC